MEAWDPHKYGFAILLLAVGDLVGVRVLVDTPIQCRCLQVMHPYQSGGGCELHH